MKKAPFVVLIGAGMPSVLAEVSFLTNKPEAQLLKTSGYKQRIAEALHAAVMRYRRSLKGVTSQRVAGPPPTRNARCAEESCGGRRALRSSVIGRRERYQMKSDAGEQAGDAAAAMITPRQPEGGDRDVDHAQARRRRADDLDDANGWRDDVRSLLRHL